MPGIHFYFPTEEQFVDGFSRIRVEHEVETHFSTVVERAAADAAAAAFESGRRDMRSVPFVTIDPEGSRDLDQAFHASRSGDGYRVHYAIADLAHFIEPHGLIDGAARRRGVTFYAPDERASLHPDVLNMDAASLLPGADRPALVWTHDLDSHGTLIGTHVERAIVRSTAALSYKEVHQDLHSGEPQELHLLLREIGILRQKKEATRGGVSLRLPSQEVVKRDGTYGLVFRATLPVENWNAQMSLLTGMAAARIMLDNKVGLLRTLPKPQKSTLAWLRRCSEALDVPYPTYLAYPDWVRALDMTDPDQAALMTQAARAFRGAGYVGFDGEVPKQTRHYAIGSDYAHVTAPLRRLIDRFANEVVLALSADKRPPAWVVDALDTIPDVMMDTSRRERAFERAIVDFAESLTLAGRIGEVFQAIATDVDDDKVALQIRKPAIVARLYADGVGLGDEIDVRLTEADTEKRTVAFELA
ncbi:MAG: RNB domain-containing ribonuclease [bacterium]|nr:RNB domain-containing ribonuclease [bacterium]